MTLSGGFVSYKPDAVRVNVADGAVSWGHDRWIVEAEYNYKYYAGKKFKPVNAWNIFGVYTIPLSHPELNFLSFEGRLDGMSDHSTGSRDENGELYCNHPERKRVTIGTSIGRIKKAMKLEFSLNYEKYFYHSNVKCGRGNDDKLLAEFIVKF